MTKAELVEQVAAAVQMPKHQTEAVITQCLEAIMAALQTGQRVDVRGFGSFQLRHRQARTGRNPRTGDTVQIPAKQVPAFTAGKAFHERVQPDAVLVTIPNAPRDALDQIVSTCAQHDVTCRFVRRDADLDPTAVLRASR